MSYARFMAKTAPSMTAKPRVKRAPTYAPGPFQARAPVASRDRTAEELRACQARLTQAQRSWSYLRPHLSADVRSTRPFDMHDAALTRRSLSGLGITAQTTMSPTMWGLLGLVVGVGATWAWLTLR